MVRIFPYVVKLLLLPQLLPIHPPACFAAPSTIPPAVGPRYNPIKNSKSTISLQYLSLSIKQTNAIKIWRAYVKQSTHESVFLIFQ
jgi:hypothetical protein